MLPCAVMTVADASVWFGDSSARRRLAAAWAASADAAPLTPGAAIAPGPVAGVTFPRTVVQLTFAKSSAPDARFVAATLLAGSEDTVTVTSGSTLAAACNCAAVPPAPAE